MNHEKPTSGEQAQSGNAPRLKIGKAFHVNPVHALDLTANCKSNCNYSSAASSGDYSYSDNADGQHYQAAEPAKAEETDSIFMDRGVQFIQDLYKYVQEQAQVIKQNKGAISEENAVAPGEQQDRTEDDLQQLYKSTNLPKKFMTKICQPFLNGGHCEHGKKCHYLHVSRELRSQKLSYSDILTESALLTQQRNAWIQGNYGEAECHWVNVKTWADPKNVSKQRKGRLPCFHNVQSQFVDSQPVEGTALEDTQQSIKKVVEKELSNDQKSGQNEAHLKRKKRTNKHSNRRKFYEQPKSRMGLV